MPRKDTVARSADPALTGWPIVPMGVSVGTVGVERVPQGAKRGGTAGVQALVPVGGEGFFYPIMEGGGGCIS